MESLINYNGITDQLQWNHDNYNKNYDVITK